MPEEEAEKKESGGGGDDGGSFISRNGWILVAATNVLWLAFVVVIMYLSEAPETKKGASDEIGKVPLGMMGKAKLELTQLVYSIPMSVGTTAMLQMDVRIVLGLTDEEKRGGVEKPSDEQWAEFQMALDALQPSIKDYLTTFIGNQSFSSLSSPGGRDKIKDELKEYVNRRLEMIEFEKCAELKKNRVDEVQIPNFIIQ